MANNKNKNCLIYASANHTDIIIKNLQVSKSDIFEISDILHSLTEDFMAKYNKVFFLFQVGTNEEISSLEKQMELILNKEKSSLVVIIPFSFEKGVNAQKVFKVVSEMQKDFSHLFVFNLSQRITDCTITLEEFYNNLCDDFNKCFNG